MNFSPPRSPDDSSDAARVTLTDTLRERTRELHQTAERSGIVRDILHGRASRADYALLLRNLLPAYEALEHALATRRQDLPAIALDEICRSGAIRSDLEALAGPGWESDLPVLAAARAYRDRIRLVATESPHLLGHAYVRYFGDLNGGQILQKLLGRSLGLGSEALSFYDFPGIADLKAFKRDYREAFDQAIRDPAGIATAAEEAAAAFHHNIGVSEAISAASADPSADAGSARP